MSAPQVLAPWLQSQLTLLLTQPGHAVLLSGPSGLGQYELALALASAWLCERPSPQGACGQCGSCHAVQVRTHPDLCVLLPEALSLALGWPLDEQTQDKIDKKERKPSREIRVDAVREAVAFTQFTRSGGDTKVVLVYPAEDMNGVSANALLKTLEEPPGAVRFVLATEAAEQLLPTIRSRCQTHALAWPSLEQALGWLQTECARLGLGGKSVSVDDLRVLLQGAGGRPADVLGLLDGRDARAAAAQWRDLPVAVARGQASVLADLGPAQAVAALQKLCHDLWVMQMGAEPRFFPLDCLGPALARAGMTGPSPGGLSRWARDLAASARTADHPFHPALLFEALTSRAQLALRGQ